MIRLLLVRFWPIFIPLIIYMLWFYWARKRGREGALFLDGPGRWAIIATLLLAIGGFLVFGLGQEVQDGVYHPAYVNEQGELVPAHVAPAAAQGDMR